MSALGLLMAGLLLAAGLCLWRAWLGPTAADRTVSVDLLGVLMVGFCAVLSVQTGRDLYMVVGLAWALIAFVGSLAIAKHLEGRRFDD